MTSYDYSRLRDTASRLLDKYGADVTVTNSAESVDTGGNGIPDYDPEFGPVPATPIVDTTQGAIIDFNMKLIDGSAILLGDKQLVLSTVGLTRDPRPGDLISAQGESWRMIRLIAQIKPANMTLAYIAQIRRA